MFGGDIVVVGVCFDVVCVGDSGCVVNESVESVLEGGGVNGPVGMLYHQGVKGRGFAEQGREVGQIYVVSLSDTQDRGTYSNFTQVTPKDFFFRILGGLKLFKRLVNSFVEVKNGLVRVRVLTKSFPTRVDILSNARYLTIPAGYGNLTPTFTPAFGGGVEFKGDWDMVRDK